MNWFRARQIKIYERLNGRCKAFLMQKHPSWSSFKKLCQQIVDEFDHILVTDENKSRELVL